MNWFKKMSMKGQLLCLVAVSALGIAVLGAASYLAISKVKVNGPLYTEIIQGKDLLADILPPPEYIIESYLTTSEMANEKDPEATAKLIERVATLRNEYDARHDVWVSGLPEGKMKETLVDRSYQPARASSMTYDNKFLPAVRAGDFDTATELVAGPLKRHYLAHRAEIDTVVSMAGDWSAANEAGAAITTKHAVWWVLAIAVATLFVIVVPGQLLARSIAHDG